MSAPTPTRDGAQGLAQALNRVVDALTTLLREHLALARAELSADVSAIGRELGRALLSVPFLLVGYALLMAGLVAWLAPRLGTDVAAASVGAVNLTIGSFLLRMAIQRLSGRRLALETSGEEIAKSLQAARAPETVVRTVRTPELARAAPGRRGADVERQQGRRDEASAGSGGDQGGDRAGQAGDRQLGAGAT